jgi:hypothetical protein
MRKVIANSFQADKGSSRTSETKETNDP